MGARLHFFVFRGVLRHTVFEIIAFALYYREHEIVSHVIFMIYHATRIQLAKCRRSSPWNGY